MNSSNSSKEGGNTSPPPKKQCSPSIRWVFTLNNWQDEEYNDIINDKVPKYCKYCIVGKEVGELKGTPHLQGYIELITKGRPIGIFNNHRIQFRKARGKREHNDIYNSKEDNNYYVWDKFAPPKVKTISKEIMYPWQLDLLDIIRKEPDDRKIYWVWSEKGGTGKTSFQKYLAVHNGALILGGKACDVRNGIIEYMKNNNKHTPNLICMNIPRSFKSEYLSYEGIENIKDMCFYSGKYEGGMVVGNPPHLIIFANIRYEEGKLSEDRIIEIGID